MCRVCQVDRETIPFVLHTRKEHLLALRYTGTNEHNNTEHVESKTTEHKKGKQSTHGSHSLESSLIWLLPDT